MRRLIKILLLLHPRSFQDRFSDEMLCTFEEAAGEGTLGMVADLTAALLRQRFGELFRGHQPAQVEAAVNSLTLGVVFQPAFPVKPSRFIWGAAIALCLFVLLPFWTGSGHARSWKQPVVNRPEARLRDSLTPSDLITFSDECAPDLIAECQAHDVGNPLFDASGTKAYELPYPSGQFGIGEVSYPLAPSAIGLGSESINGGRKLTVWYPARLDYRTSVAVQNVWSYSKGLARFVQTHTVQNATIVEGTTKFPLIVFCPNADNPAAAYLSQIENLVSHGYIVASREDGNPPHLMAFGDTKLLTYEADLRRASFWPKTKRDDVLGRADGFQYQRELSDSESLRLALDQITLLVTNKLERPPFADRIDLLHAGALGQGSGGSSVAQFCASHSEISACVDEDGWSAAGLFSKAMATPLPRQSFLWINVRANMPDDAALQYARISRDRFRQILDTAAIRAELELTSMGAHAYQATLTSPGVLDKNFTDGPLVWSMASQHRADDKARMALAVTNTLVRSFFDCHLKHWQTSVLESKDHTPRSILRVKNYAHEKG